uniref:Uncharacterized protein n=1 Tax=Salix viminalis TaxID=40686 RepID=A0A6N2NA94_SALVM
MSEKETGESLVTTTSLPQSSKERAGRKAQPLQALKIFELETIRKLWLLLPSQLWQKRKPSKASFVRDEDERSEGGLQRLQQ